MIRRISALISIWLLWASPCFAGAIQVKAATISGATSNPNTINATFDSTPTAGNYIVACVNGYATATTSDVAYSDNKSNSYVQDKKQHDTSVTGHMISMGSAYVSSSSATFTVTASVTNTAMTAQYLRLFIAEFSGVTNAHADKTQSNINTGATSTTADTGTTATTTYPDELIVACLGSDDASARTWTKEQAGTAPSSGWTQEATYTTVVNSVYASVTASSTVAARHVYAMSAASHGYGVIGTFRLDAARRRIIPMILSWWREEE